jgi:hypothetical protein
MKFSENNEQLENEGLLNKCMTSKILAILSNVHLCMSFVTDRQDNGNFKNSFEKSFYLMQQSAR